MNSINALIQHAAEMEFQGRLSEAEATYRKCLAIHPHHAAVWHLLGLVIHRSGRLAEASQCLAKATLHDGRKAIYYRDLGEILRRMGQIDSSITAGRAACELAPQDLDAHYNLALAYGDGAQYAKAVIQYRKAIKLNPNHGLSWNNLGAALERQGDKFGALKAYERAVSINAHHVEALNNQGALYTQMGRLDEARESFNAAIQERPDFVEAHYNLCSLKTYTNDDPQLLTLESLFSGRDQWPELARIRYSFALAKALDDIGQFDRAFESYEYGNRLQHKLLPFDELREIMLVESIQEVFTDDFLAKRRPIDSDGQLTPIFIVGMPRSGTTLLEQILCSHPSVYGAGELTDFHDVIAQMTGASSTKKFTEGVLQLSNPAIKKIGDEYLKRVHALSPRSRYLTDKMPANFFYIGLIHLALPNAKIIHAMRDPMDSCFSCYTRLFAETMEFAYDQGTLGRYYQRYMTLMEHWHEVLPEGRVLDVRYEDLVADTETQARRILDYVGLPWDSKCLEFHKNKRLVKTASVAQVRQPIYKTSIARWKHFASHLQPLIQLVRPASGPAGDGQDTPECHPMAFGNQDPVSFPPLCDSSSTVSSGFLVQLIEKAQRLQGKGQHQDVLNLLKPILDSSWEGETAAIAWHIQGISQYRLDQFMASRRSYERALAIKPDFPAALNSYGFLLQDMGEMERSLKAFEEAVALMPEMAMARLNLGMAQLKVGDFESGWENYEARWTGSVESVQGTFMRPACPLPAWQGGDGPELASQSILVFSEQGFGDTFQFARYLPFLSKQFAHVGFVCSLPTARVMEWSFGDQVTLFTKIPTHYDGWDWHSSLMSLPRAFKTRVATIPAEVPYLKVPKAPKAYWQARLELAAPGRFRVGVAWAGRAAHQSDRRRSLNFDQIQTLLQHQWVTWISLQKWTPEDAKPAPPTSADWLDWTDDLSDFGDTAALVENLDLIISVDSSMVHLAGGLNKPVWMLNRFDAEWRWLESKTKSPWYPKLRIFNQPVFGDWTSVIHEVNQELHKLPIPKVRAKTRNPGENRAYGSHPGQVQIHSTSPQNLSDQSLRSPTCEEAFHHANQLHMANQLTEADQVLRQILAQRPDHAHALHLLAVVRYQEGKVAEALEGVRVAIELAPREALFRSNLTEMCRQQGLLEEAVREGRAAVALDPSSAPAHSNLGVVFYDMKAYDEAEASHQRALAITPNLVPSLNNLGSIERARGNRARAINYYRQVLSINSDYLEAQINLGAVLLEHDKAEESLPILHRALQQSPHSHEALCNLGLARFKLGETAAAFNLLKRSLDLKPNYREALIGLARVFQEQDQLDEAEAQLNFALTVTSDQDAIFCLLGAIATERNQSEKAESLYRKVLQNDPYNSEALVGVAYLGLERGDLNAAQTLLEQVIDREPDNIGALFHLTQSRKTTSKDGMREKLEKQLVRASHLDAEDRVLLHYGLGKVYEDLGEYDKAFPCFIEGARLKRSKLAFDPNLEAMRVQKIIQWFTSERINALRAEGDPSHLPVFIVGMPRSGTTLTEQIIASHPKVHGAGELRDLLEVVQQPVMGSSIAFPENLDLLSAKILEGWGGDYVKRLSQYDATALRITDKMPANYMALGLIHLMLPQAKIIHVKRNPIDTCVSCFTRLFNRHQEATYDLVELGQHYVRYSELMKHWKEVLPPGSFIEVDYEAIVDNIEEQARRLVEGCGLEWDEGCLSFYCSKRAVRTASLTQVRQPIYRGSVERWRHYESYLGPLINELQPVL